MKICASVRNIRFRTDSGWAVVDFVDETNLRFVGVGVMPAAYEGEKLELEGEWTVHKTYGRQFKVESCTPVAPTGEDQVFKYLSSGLIRGVGEATAKAIIAMFGEKTLEILENEPEKLVRVPGIGKVRSKMIHESFMEKRSVQQVFIGLQELGINMNQANRLYKLYGEGCVQRIKENPYKLIEDVDSIGFKTADNIARNAGFEHDSPFRVRAGVRHMLMLASQEGHTCMPRAELIGSVSERLLGVETALTEHIVEEMILKGDLIEQHFLDNDFIFLRWLHYAEIDGAVRLGELASSANVLPMADIEGEIERLERQFSIRLDEKQRLAVTTAVNEGVMVITGGPGTGKTTILRFIIELMEGMGLALELAAPTGRAAKRISDTTGREARTLHRLLEYGFEEEAFGRGEDRPIEADVIIVDEMSMVDVPLFHALLKAVMPGTRLIMVGDHDQLPSVGPGNVLRDIINSETMPVFRLTDIYRQAGRSMIVINAHRINNGQPPVADKNETDFVMISRPGMEETLATVVNICCELKRRGEDDFQVLAPMKQNVVGVYNLNEKLQEALNPPDESKAECKYGEVVFRVGDRVMQTKNNYDMEWKRRRLGKKEEDGRGVFNGDIGTVMGVDRSGSSIEILFDDERLALFSRNELEDVMLAYAISIHKSQGSEFKTVILPLVYGPPMLMNRNVLYTAVTRARSRVVIVGVPQCVANMAHNRMNTVRFSGMEQFLRRLKEGFDE